MGIPVKLWRHARWSGLPIHLEATEFRMAIERNVSAFALPFNNAYKFGLDLNMPQTVLNITGILEDDENAPRGDTKSSGKIRTDGFYPSYNSGMATSVMDDIRLIYPEITAKNNYSVGATSILVQGISTMPATISGVFSKKLRLHDIFSIGDTIYTSYNLHAVGIITAINPLTNELTIGAGTLKALYRGTSLINTTPDAFLHHKGFLLQPALWRNGNPDKPPQIPNDMTIVYRFDGNTKSQYATGGSATPSFVAGTEPENSTSGNRVHPIISIPIGSIYTSTNPAGAAAGNPAKALALSIKDAIDSTPVITSLEVDETGGRRSTDAFSTSLSSDGYEVKITKKEAEQNKPYNMLTNYISYHRPLTNWSSVNYYTSGATAMRADTLPYHSEFTGYGDDNLSGVKSAGDKAQDLLGIFANSKVGSESELVGIQVPYYSLINSNTIDADVRNFFLTFGNVSPDQKTSEGNDRDASGDLDFNSDVLMSPDGVIDAEEEGAEPPPLDHIRNLGESLIDLIGDVGRVGKGVTQNGTNNGGILIIPTKLNIRYDAGQRHYTYDMVLSAVNDKIAP